MFASEPGGQTVGAEAGDGQAEPRGQAVQAAAPCRAYEPAWQVIQAPMAVPSGQASPGWQTEHAGAAAALKAPGGQAWCDKASA